MLQILHVADLHIGVENYGQFDVKRGMHQRLIDFLACFDEAIEIAITKQVDLVLVAGDMFKNRSPLPRHQSEFAARMRRLRDANIPVLLLIGNHDVAPGRDSANSVSVYEGLKFDGVTVARRPDVYRYSTPHGALAVIAIPWLMREMLVSNNDSLRQVGLGEQEREMVRIVETYIQEQVAILTAEDAQRPIVVTYHGTVTGAISGFERQLMLGSEIQLPQSVLCPAGVDYVALGHVHKHQQLRTDPPMVYAGSIERIDFGEINEDKGCVLVTFAAKQASHTFIPLHGRPFVHIEVDVTQSGEQPMDRIYTALTRKDVKDAIVKVTIDALPVQRSMISERQIRIVLEGAGAAFVARVLVHVPRTDGLASVNMNRQDRLPTPVEALEIFLRRDDISDDERRILLAMGQSIMDESTQ